MDFILIKASEADVTLSACWRGTPEVTSAEGRVTDYSQHVAEELQSQIRRQPWLGAGNRSKGKHEAGRLGFLNKICVKRQAGKKSFRKGTGKWEEGME